MKINTNLCDRQWCRQERRGPILTDGVRKVCGASDGLDRARRGVKDVVQVTG